ncbi:MAG: transketolase family protein [Alkalispirochaeta sp.]
MSTGNNNATAPAKLYAPFMAEGSKEMRAAYVETLIRLAEKDERIILLDADLMSAHKTINFQKRFPDRGINMGVAEANMVGVSAGLSTMGKIPFPTTFACFATRRAFDQFFISANYARQNVKLVGTDPGVSAEFNGGTHMPFEDIALTRVIPDLVIVDPADEVAAEEIIPRLVNHEGCTYMRIQRKGAPRIYAEGETFPLGKGKVLRDGTDITIVAAGSICVPESLKAAELLEKEGVSVAVLDMYSIKPVDGDLLEEYARKTGAIVTCENHQVKNGLGSAVAEELAERYPTLVVRHGIMDLFGEVGLVDYLMERYGLTAARIADRVRETLKKKQQ